MLRKYDDSILINIYSILFLKDNFSVENFVVDKIDKWVKGIEKMPDNRIIVPFINNSEWLKTINPLLKKDDRYKVIKERCNDFMHYNFYHNLLLNDNEVHFQERVKLLNIFSSDARNLFIKHFAYLFTTNELYMQSSDYIDYLDIGQNPPKDSEYFGAPFVQDIFDSVVKKYRPDIANELKNNTNMMLE